MRRDGLRLVLLFFAAFSADLRASGADGALLLALPEQAGTGTATLPKGDTPPPPTQSTPGEAEVPTWGDNCGYIPPEARGQPNS